MQFIPDKFSFEDVYPAKNLQHTIIEYYSDYIKRNDISFLNDLYTRLITNDKNMINIGKALFQLLNVLDITKDNLLSKLDHSISGELFEVIYFYMDDMNLSSFTSYKDSNGQYTLDALIPSGADEQEKTITNPPFGILKRRRPIQGNSTVIITDQKILQTTRNKSKCFKVDNLFISCDNPYIRRDILPINLFLDENVKSIKLSTYLYNVCWLGHIKVNYFIWLDNMYKQVPIDQLNKYLQVTMLTGSDDN